MKTRNYRRAIVCGGGLWLALVGYVVWQWMAFDHIAGDLGVVPLVWPAESTLQHDATHGTLVVFAHPRCACTRSGLHKLHAALVGTGSRAACHVLFLPVDASTSESTHSANGRAAANIPRAQLQTDHDGVEAKRFGATTSGFVLYYDAGGQLRFAGGLSTQRGGEQISTSEQLLRQTLALPDAPLIYVPIFGCALRNRP